MHTPVSQIQNNIYKRNHRTAMVVKHKIDKTSIRVVSLWDHMLAMEEYYFRQA